MLGISVYLVKQRNRCLHVELLYAYLSNTLYLFHPSYPINYLMMRLIELL
jgi:hypothetical protein